jgi:glycosyltransferase involved in cell wall biosynthesis
VASGPRLSTLADRSVVSESVLVALYTGHVPSMAGRFRADDRDTGVRIDMLDRRAVRGPQVMSRLLREGRRYDAVILDGSIGLRQGYLDLLAAAALTRGRRAPVVVLADCTWTRGSWWLDRAACRAGIRAVDRANVTFCVLSTEEAARFPDTWGVDPGRVAFTPFCFTLSDEELTGPVSDDGGVFAGGNSLRDYATLIDAASALPVDVTIAARPREVRVPVHGAWPANVRLASLSHERFVEAMRRASVVVVPLKPEVERSAGHQTYLNAMALGKPVVVTEAPGVRDHVDDGVTGIVVPPRDPDALRGALAWALDPGNRPQVAAMGARARRAVLERFTPQRYLERVLEVAFDALHRADD